MFKTHIAPLVASILWLGVACWAAPQMGIDPVGVTVQPAGAEVVHRAPVAYPRQAVEKGVEGQVVAQVRLDASGNVLDASILSGPEELRKPVLQSVLGWHFAKEDGDSTRQVAVVFALPEAKAQLAEADKRRNLVEARAMEQLNAARTAKADNAPAATGALEPKVISGIRVEGLSERSREQVLGLIGLSVGSPLDPATAARIMQHVRAYDEHLIVRLLPVGKGKTSILVTSNPDPSATTVISSLSSNTGAAPALPGAVRVGGNVQASNLVSKVNPEYPELAKRARVQGGVQFEAVIGKDGSIQNLRLISGPPLLVQAAIQAVQQWKYKPTLLNGSAVEVITTIDVNFTLSE